MCGVSGVGGVGGGMPQGKGPSARWADDGGCVVSRQRKGGHCLLGCRVRPWVVALHKIEAVAAFLAVALVPS